MKLFYRWGVWILALGIVSCAKSSSPSSSTTSEEPTAGTAISASVQSRTQINVSWGAASDNSTTASLLQYKLVKATASSAVDTVSEADAITGADLLLDWTANTLSTNATSLTANTTYYFAVLVKDTDGNKTLYTPQSATTPNYYRIYVTAITYGGDLDGVTGADTICGMDSGKPSTGTYKAMLAAATRIACTTASCSGGVGEHTDWVLQPSANYARTDGTAIGTTTSAGIFSFPLTNGIGTTGTVWTGLASNWTNSANNCGNWDNSGVNGTEANAANTDSSSIATALFGCGNSDHLYCVEQ